MKITTSTTLEPGDIAAVFRTESGGYRVVMKDGSARTFRRVQLTHEALSIFEEIAAASTWEKLGG